VPPDHRPIPAGRGMLSTALRLTQAMYRQHRRAWLESVRDSRQGKHFVGGLFRMGSPPAVAQRRKARLQMQWHGIVHLRANSGDFQFRLNSSRLSTRTRTGCTRSRIRVRRRASQYLLPSTVRCSSGVTAACCRPGIRFEASPAELQLGEDRGGSFRPQLVVIFGLRRGFGQTDLSASAWSFVTIIPPSPAAPGSCLGKS